MSNENKTAEEVKNLIAGRIKDEHRKHSTLEWEEIAAAKIYNQWYDFYHTELSEKEAELIRLRFEIEQLSATILLRERRIENAIRRNVLVETENESLELQLAEQKKLSESLLQNADSQKQTFDALLKKYKEIRQSIEISDDFHSEDN